MRVLSPSIAPVAIHCGLAVTLNKTIRESTVYAKGGEEAHRLFEEAVKAFVEKRVTVPFWDGLVSRLFGELEQIAGKPTHIETERALTLVDPDTGDRISKGRADLVVRTEHGIRIVIDLKSGKTAVDHPNENLQLLIYGAMVSGLESKWLVGVVYSDSGSVVLSDVFDAEKAWEIIETVRKANDLDPSLPVTGPHCSKCFRSHHCPAYMLPWSQGEKALVPFEKPGGLTAANAPLAINVLEALELACDRARQQLKDLSREIGGIVSTDGKRVWGLTTKINPERVSLSKISESTRAILRAEGAISPPSVGECFRWKNVEKTKKT